MTLVYTFLLGLGFTLILSGVYSMPYVATVKAILSGQPLSIGGATNNSVPPSLNPLPPGIKTPKVTL